MSNALVKQTVLMAGIVIVGGVLLGLAFHGSADHTAIWISGAVAFVVQMLAFSLARVAGKASLMARLGVGMLLRFLALAIYGLLVVLVFKQLPATSALISLFVFFFFSSVIEPLFIK